MAREPMDIVKMQLGSLLMEVAVLTSQLEQARERIVELEKPTEKHDG
jgi:hypothetical protein